MYRKEEKPEKEDILILIASTSVDGHHYDNSHKYKVAMDKAVEYQKIIEVAYEKLSNVKPIVYYGGVVQEIPGSGLTKEGLIKQIARDHHIDLEEAKKIISSK